MSINYRKLVVDGQKLSMFCKFSTFRNTTLGLLALIGTSGCTELFKPSIASICEEHPAMCADLNPDAWCRAEKADLIRHRFAHQNGMTTGRQKYERLLHLEHYQACIVKAAQIRHIKHRDKEAGRMQGVLTAQDRLKKLKWRTRNDNDPYLSYYHWSRFNDEAALQRFLAFAKAGALNHDPALLIALAAIQAKQSTQHTRQTLYKALSLYSSDDDINKEVFVTLTTLAIDEQQYGQAYLWARVAHHYDGRINISRYKAMATRHAIAASQLEDKADAIIDALGDGEFDARRLRLDEV